MNSIPGPYEIIAMTRDMPGRWYESHPVLGEGVCIHAAFIGEGNRRVLVSLTLTSLYSDGIAIVLAEPGREIGYIGNGQDWRLFLNSTTEEEQ